MDAGKVEEARGVETRSGCGYDFSQTVLNHPFDGAEHETPCPKCGVVTSWNDGRLACTCNVMIGEERLRTHCTPPSMRKRLEKLLNSNADACASDPSASKRADARPYHPRVNVHGESTALSTAIGRVRTVGVGSGHEQ